MRGTTTNTKERILDVAQDLIQRRGLNAMSFQDLSDAVGIRKASVHHYFANKPEMVNALLLRYQTDFADAVNQILRSRGSGKTKLGRYFGLFQQTLQAGQHDKSCLCGMLVAEIYSLDDDGVALLRRFLRENAEYLCEMINAGIDDGSLSVRGDAAVTAEMVLATLEGALLLARCDGGPKRFSRMLQQLMMLLSAH
jgi:TetR/AcrR family transcriptional regulator, transcriptional repressor for nem operon